MLNWFVRVVRASIVIAAALAAEFILSLEILFIGLLLLLNLILFSEFFAETLLWFGELDGEISEVLALVELLLLVDDELTELLSVDESLRWDDEENPKPPPILPLRK